MCKDQTPTIHPNRLYKPPDLEALLGRRCMQLLRKAGLRAGGGWYLGQSVCDSFQSAWQRKTCQRVPSGKEEAIEKEHAENVEKDRRKGEIQLVPKHPRREDLRSQLEEVRQLRTSEVSGRKH